MIKKIVDLEGVPAEAYPVEVFNVNEESLGFADNGAEYKALWNADPDNAAFGQITAYGGMKVMITLSHPTSVMPTFYIYGGIAEPTPTAFNPADYGTVARWWSADDLPLNDGDPVGSWADAIANHTLTASSSVRPIYKKGSGIFEGTLPVVRFDGTDDILTAADTGLPTGDVTIVCVTKCATASLATNALQVVYDYGDETANRNLIGSFMGQQSGGLVPANSFGSWVAGSYRSVGDVTNGWIVTVIRRVGTAYTVRVNRDKGVLSTAGSTSSILLGGNLSVGGYHGGGARLNGDIRHLIMYNEALSDDNIFDLTKKLMDEAIAPVTSYVSTSTGNDSTAVRGSASLKFATIDAALDASAAAAIWKDTLGFDTFNLSAGNHASVTSSKLKSGYTFQGALQPGFNSSTAPTALTGGTVIRGPLYTEGLSDNKYYDLGIDSGPTVCTTYYGGTAQEGFLNTGSPSAHPSVNDNLIRIGFEAKRITVLAKDASSLVHNTLVEHTLMPVVDHIKTFYGFAGFVTKTTHGTFSNIETHKHGDAGLYVKGNNYARCEYNNYTNVTAEGCLNALHFVSEDSGATNHHNTIDGLTSINNNKAVLSDVNAGGLAPANNTVKNITSTGSMGAAADMITLLSGDDFTIESANISGSLASGIAIDTVVTDTHLVSVVVNSNAGYGVSNGSTTTTGSGQVSGTGNTLGLLGGNPLL